MKSLRNRIILTLAVAALLPLLVMGIVQSHFTAQLVEASSDSLLAARLDQMASALESFDQRYRGLAAAVTHWAHRDGEVLRRLVRDDAYVTRASVVDRKGSVLSSSDAAREGSTVSRAYLRELFATAVTQVSIEAGVVEYAAPLGRDGAVEGAVILDVPLDALTTPLRSVLGLGTVATLSDGAGRILWHPPQGPRLQDSQGKAQERVVRGTGWTLLAAGDDPVARQSREAAMRSSLLACAVALVLAILVQFLAVRRALAPISQMTSAAADVARGNYEARIPLDGHAELDALARSFNEMAGTLSVARAGLEDKVRKRTQELEAINVEMASRNRELAEQSEELARHRYHEQAKGRALAALTADAELDQVAGAALGEVAGPVGAAVMVCYRLDGAELVPVAGYAATESARRTAVPLAGLAAEALSKNRIETLDQMPPELDLRFDCLVAAGTPRALALVPLRVGNRPSGVLAVGALAPLSKEAITTLSDLAAPLALTIARRALLDHTERIARELARRNEELRTQAEALEAQGEELKAQQRELSLKNREVQKADQLKTEFLANMSHELRTPLNAVIGFSELLIEDRATISPTQAQWVNDIHESGRHLLTLINRVLDLAKIEAGRTSFQLEPVAPSDAVASACTLVRPAANKKGIVVGVVESTARPVQADRGHLNQVLINLIANAVKFSPENAAVEVGFAEESGQVRFWVKDQGPGIDAETQARLFEPFFQAESPLVKKHEGTGLGLAISRKLVQAQGGRIGVTSTLGAGSTFFFTLPLAPEAPAPVRPVEDAGPPVFTGGPPLVLVVDDHDLNRELAREMLERRGCRVILARDGEEGVRRARSEHPGLVLVDLAMPRKDGFAVARELRSDPATAHTPLVALTALAMRGDDERVLQAGFDGYLPKPLERAALDAALNRFVAHRSTS